MSEEQTTFTAIPTAAIRQATETVNNQRALIEHQIELYTTVSRSTMELFMTVATLTKRIEQLEHFVAPLSVQLTKISTQLAKTGEADAVSK